MSRTAIAALLSLAAASELGSAAAAQEVRVLSEQESREASLERSLRLSAFDFDSVSFLGAQRTLLMGVFELYCAAELLIPPADGFRALDFGLGLGCLAGATTLLVLGVRRLLRPKEGERAHTRLVDFYTQRRTGAVDWDDFERRLDAAAKRDQRRRWVRLSLGVLELGAAATVAGLAARDRIDRTTGASIAIGTAIIGILGVVHALLRSPAERAAIAHRERPRPSDPARIRRW